MVKFCIFAIALIIQFTPGSVYGGSCIDNSTDALNACLGNCPPKGKGGNNKAYFDCKESCDKDQNSRISSCNYQEEVNQKKAAKKSKENHYKMAAKSAAAGATFLLMAKTADPSKKPFLEVMGKGLIAGGILSYLQGRDEAAAVEKYESKEVIDNPCTRDPNGVECAGYKSENPEISTPDYATGNGDIGIKMKEIYEDPATAPEERAIISDLIKEANSAGVNILDPEVVKALMAKSNSGSMSDSDVAAAMAGLSPNAKAAIEKAKKKYEDKYGVGSGDAEEGGGGGAFAGNGNSSRIT